MKPAALGFRVHSGWTSLIAVALEKNQPIILARQRPHLVATFSYTFRQPYHTAEKMNLAEAQTFLDQQRDEATQARSRSNPLRTNRSRPTRFRNHPRRAAPSLRPPAPRTPQNPRLPLHHPHRRRRILPRSPAPRLRPRQSPHHQTQRPRTPSHRLQIAPPESRRPHPLHQRSRQTPRLPLDRRRKIRHPSRLARSTQFGAKVSVNSVFRSPCSLC